MSISYLNKHPQAAASTPMTDLDTSTHTPRLPQIDLDDSDDVHRWCEVFNCNATDLKEAVNEVGPLAEDVHQFLRNRPPQTVEDAKVLPSLTWPTTVGLKTWADLAQTA